MKIDFDFVVENLTNAIVNAMKDRHKWWSFVNVEFFGSENRAKKAIDNNCMITVGYYWDNNKEDFENIYSQYRRGCRTWWQCLMGWAEICHLWDYKKGTYIYAV